MTLVYDRAGVQLHQGDASAVLSRLEPATVQACLSSPPYFSMRDYGTEPQVYGGAPDCAHRFAERRWYAAGGSAAQSSRDAHSVAGGQNAARVKAARWRTEERCEDCDAWRGHLGSEESVEAYAEHLALVFRDVRRLLRPDGVVWLNLGDCFAGSGYSNHRGTGNARREDGGRQRHVRADGFRTKSLLGVPWRVAFALQADGWLLRQVVIWHKTGPTPEPSAKDRPWSEAEYVFLLAASGRYYYCDEGTGPRGNVWRLPKGRYAGHSAVMPIELAYRCLSRTTRPGDLVLDPFAGSGTTLVAARRLGCRAVGVELKPESAALAQQRLEMDAERAEAAS